MILLTTGTMLPFDRLVQAVDNWAAKNKDIEVVAQIGNSGVYIPKHMRWMRLLNPQEFAELVRNATLLIAHAGTGSFFLAAEMQRPVVLFPRRAALREHTTDHQVHTASWLRDKPGVYVAFNEEDLPDAIARALSRLEVGVDPVSAYAPEPFLGRIRNALMT